MRLDHLETIRIVSDDELQRELKRSRYDGTSQTRVLAPFWRQLRVSGNAKVLFLELRSVDEQTAFVNQWTEGTAEKKFSLTWDDLEDVQLVNKMVAHELFIVATRVIQILSLLRTNRDMLISKLAAGKG